MLFTKALRFISVAPRNSGKFDPCAFLKPDQSRHIKNDLRFPFFDFAAFTQSCRIRWFLLNVAGSLLNLAVADYGEVIRTRCMAVGPGAWSS